jgi:FAD/FMN-containing dehydrogenase
VLGNPVSYVIDVRSAEDVRAGIEFSREHNIRLVIKNTGHDYAGKSTAKGGLSLWTHNLNSTQFIPTYESSYYTGPAIKLGAGIQGFGAYAAANATGHRIVGGVCPTVGIAGGFSLGGGHSILSNVHGTGSDNVLEWEGVTMDRSLWSTRSGVLFMQPWC